MAKSINQQQGIMLADKPLVLLSVSSRTKNHQSFKSGRRSNLKLTMLEDFLLTDTKISKRIRISHTILKNKSKQHLPVYFVGFV